MKTYYEDPSSPLRTVDCEVPVAPEDELRFEQRADDERYAVLEPLANEEEERRERQTTQARQDQEQARWIRGARSPSETRTRLGSVLDGIPPDSERADRFRGIAAEHAKHTEKLSRCASAMRSGSAVPACPRAAVETTCAGLGLIKRGHVPVFHPGVPTGRSILKSESDAGRPSKRGGREPAGSGLAANGQWTPAFPGQRPPRWTISSTV
jgi:hypothetical protein